AQHRAECMARATVHIIPTASVPARGWLDPAGRHEGENAQAVLGPTLTVVLRQLFAPFLVPNDFSNRLATAFEKIPQIFQRHANDLRRFGMLGRCAADDRP